jgi:hypothetical protein
MKNRQESPILEAALAAMTEDDLEKLTSQANEEALDIFSKSSMKLNSFKIFDEYIEMDEETKSELIEKTKFLEEKNFVMNKSKTKWILWIDWMDENQLSQVAKTLKIKTTDNGEWIV